MVVPVPQSVSRFNSLPSQDRYTLLSSNPNWDRMSESDRMTKIIAFEASKGQTNYSQKYYNSYQRTSPPTQQTTTSDKIITPAPTQQVTPSQTSSFPGSSYQRSPIVLIQKPPTVATPERTYVTPSLITDILGGKANERPSEFLFKNMEMMGRSRTGTQGTAWLNMARAFDRNENGRIDFNDVILLRQEEYRRGVDVKKNYGQWGDQYDWSWVGYYDELVHATLNKGSTIGNRYAGGKKQKQTRRTQKSKRERSTTRGFGYGLW